jgi:hypothetical protein
MEVRKIERWLSAGAPEIRIADSCVERMGLGTPFQQEFVAERESQAVLQSLLRIQHRGKSRNMASRRLGWERGEHYSRGMRESVRDHSEER